MNKSMLDFTSPEAHRALAAVYSHLIELAAQRRVGLAAHDHHAISDDARPSLEMTMKPEFDTRASTSHLTMAAASIPIQGTLGVAIHGDITRSDDAISEPVALAIIASSNDDGRVDQSLATK